ncbi:nucleotidyl transferase AbiEii/AbiGii toxin family protein [bacterium]|nr:nucleotidyl transferase AbiEii/AbiGii toxin family protein [bacterium]
MNKTLHFNILPLHQLDLFKLLSNQDFIANFYLAGGTGLALQIGHRQSIDFDFFIPNDFNTTRIIQELKSIGNFELHNEEQNTINGMLNQIRISFFGYKYKVINPFLNYRKINIADELDIAAMKLEAISGRGNKKDFIDLYFMLQKYSINNILKFYEKKYGKGIANNYHLMKSLTYFQDAEEQAMPEMIEHVDWGTVKKEIINKVKKIKLIG